MLSSPYESLSAENADENSQTKEMVGKRKAGQCDGGDVRIKGAGILPR